MITLRMVKPLGGVLKRIGVKTLMDEIQGIDIQDKDASERIGRAFIGCALEKMEDAADDIVKLCAAYRQVSEEEALDLDAIQVIKDMFAEAGFADFFKRVARKVSQE